MFYDQEKQFFASLQGRPEWLTKSEWLVLRHWFAPANPCTPEKPRFLERLAGEFYKSFSRIGSFDAGYRAAERALESGLKKVRSRLDAGTQPAAPAAAVASPQRSRYDLWQSGLDGD